MEHETETVMTEGFSDGEQCKWMYHRSPKQLVGKVLQLTKLQCKSSSHVSLCSISTTATPAYSEQAPVLWCLNCKRTARKSINFFLSGDQFSHIAVQYFPASLDFGKRDRNQKARTCSLKPPPSLLVTITRIDSFGSLPK